MVGLMSHHHTRLSSKFITYMRACVKNTWCVSIIFLACALVWVIALAGLCDRAKDTLRCVFCEVCKYLKSIFFGSMSTSPSTSAVSDDNQVPGAEVDDTAAVDGVMTVNSGLAV